MSSIRRRLVIRAKIMALLNEIVMSVTQAQGIYPNFVMLLWLQCFEQINFQKFLISSAETLLTPEMIHSNP